MNDIINFLEVEESDEFEFQPIEWNTDEILDWFKRYCNNSNSPSVDYESQNEGYYGLVSSSNRVEGNPERIGDKGQTIVENELLFEKQSNLELDSNKNEDLNVSSWEENRVEGMYQTVSYPPENSEIFK